jgi:hypothetical protein
MGRSPHAWEVLCLTLALALCPSCGERASDSSPRAPRGGDPVAPPSGAVAAVAPTPPASEEAALVLPIPAREQAPESPSAGWCGETAIQEALLHLGVWAPQRIVNRAGRPTHPDLYSPEIPVALSELGVRYRFYQARAKGFDAFSRWVRSALDEGVPVLAGVKLLPTDHPEWGLDHFVLVVGYGERGLLVNTTWGDRRWVADTSAPARPARGTANRAKELSFKNASYALRLDGVLLPPHASPAQLRVVEEGGAVVKVHVLCTGLRTGATYRVERRLDRSEAKPVSTAELVAASERVETEVTVEAERVSRFQCVPAAPSVTP